MIYITEFDPVSLQCISLSVDSGFATLGDVIETMGIPNSIPTPRVAIYSCIAFSDFPFNEGEGQR